MFVVVVEVPSHDAATSESNQPSPADQQGEEVQPTNQDAPTDKQPTNEGETVETDS